MYCPGSWAQQLIMFADPPCSFSGGCWPLLNSTSPFRGHCLIRLFSCQKDGVIMCRRLESAPKCAHCNRTRNPRALTEAHRPSSSPYLRGQNKRDEVSSIPIYPLRFVGRSQTVRRTHPPIQIHCDIVPTGGIAPCRIRQSITLPGMVPGGAAQTALGNLGGRTSITKYHGSIKTIHEPIHLP
jgi:hypothetical protein